MSGAIRTSKSLATFSLSQISHFPHLNPIGLRREGCGECGLLSQPEPFIIRSPFRQPERAPVPRNERVRGANLAVSINFPFNAPRRDSRRWPPLYPVIALRACSANVQPNFSVTLLNNRPSSPSGQILPLVNCPLFLSNISRFTIQCETWKSWRTSTTTRR